MTMTKLHMVVVPVPATSVVDVSHPLLTLVALRHLTLLTLPSLLHFQFHLLAQANLILRNRIRLIHSKLLPRKSPLVPLPPLNNNILK